MPELLEQKKRATSAKFLFKEMKLKTKASSAAVPVRTEEEKVSNEREGRQNRFGRDVRKTEHRLSRSRSRS